MKKLFGLFLLLAGMNAIAQNVGVGTTTPSFKLDVRVGSINTDSLYRINSLPVLSIKGNGNLFVGDNAGRNTTANGNTFAGDSAGISNSTGVNNTSVGQLSMASNTTGIFNVAVGNRALFSNTTGVNNTAVGMSSMALNQTGENNTAVGIGALQGNLTGHANTAMGEAAIANSTAGEGNVGIGYAAIPNNETGNYNVAVGTSSLSNNVSGSHNTALGFNTRTAGTALTNATAVGAYAVVGSSNSLVLGSINGVNGATSSTNIGIGTSTPSFRLDVRNGSINTDSLYRIGSTPVLSVKGNNNLFVGENAGRVTTSNENTFVGDSAGFFNTSGYANVFIGNATGYSNNVGTANTAIGSSCLVGNTTGSYNIAMGYGTMSFNQTGINNTAIGTFALLLSTSSYNTAIGTFALQANTSGERNTGVGNNILYKNTTGLNNTAMGEAAMYENLGGSNNTALGFGALNTNVAGSGNTGIGYNSDVSTAGLSNATAIGAWSYVGVNNALVLGSINGVNGATASARVGIGTSSPGATFHVVSQDASMGIFDGGSNMYLTFRESGVYRGYLGSFSGAASDMDFGTGAGNTGGAVHLTIQASPQFTIASDGSATLYDNELHRTSTGAANLVPIAYGNISSTGFIQAGSGNFTVTHTAASGLYQIAITGENYQFQQYITVATPIGTLAPYIACTGSGGGMLQVQLYTIAGADVDQNFHFVVYKP